MSDYPIFTQEALDKLKDEHIVPLTHDVDGEHIVIGEAKVVVDDIGMHVAVIKITDSRFTSILGDVDHISFGTIS